MLTMAIGLLLMNFTGNKNSTNSINEFSNAYDKNFQTVKVTGTMKLHRGKKWSTENKVTPCTTSFGICSITLTEISISYGNQVTLENVDENTILLSFSEDYQALKRGIFYSDQDDPFEFPFDLAKSFGYTSVTVAPKNYEVKKSKEYPFGFVKLALKTN